MSIAAPVPPSLEGMQALIAEDLSAVLEQMEHALRSDIPLIGELSRHLIHSGGKRMRPMLCLLVARAFQQLNPAHIQLSTLVEFIHTATLLHDDVVDDSKLRRGRHTANALWGNSASVLVGDFLYSRAFELMIELQNLRILELMAHTTNRIAEGEVMQLLASHHPELAVDHYLQLIEAKTALLFSATCTASAWLSHASESQAEAMGRYGLHLGMAFQLVDDALDYQSQAEVLGKNPGDDLEGGKITLPVIHCLQHSSPAVQQKIKTALEQGHREALPFLQTQIANTGSLEYTYSLARSHKEQAVSELEKLEPSPYRQALNDLMEFAIQRTF